jgi:eukaryotic-like serine/threonine-protein kinase
MDVRQQLGPYQLLSLIAVGGMSETFVGARSGPGGFSQRVCVKRILAQDSATPRWIERFLKEGRIAAKLRHSNIVTLHEFG